MLLVIYTLIRSLHYSRSLVTLSSSNLPPFDRSLRAVNFSVANVPVLYHGPPCLATIVVLSPVQCCLALTTGRRTRLLCEFLLV